MPLLMNCVNNIPKTINCTEQEHIRAPLNSVLAACWESAPAAGDAACSKDCMLYPFNAPPLPVPGPCTPLDGDSTTGPFRANSNHVGTQPPPSTSLGTEEGFSLPAPSKTKRATEIPSYTEPKNEPTPLTAPPSGPEQTSQSLPADFSTLPTASLPSYVTTATAALAPFTSHPMQSSSRPPFPFPFPMSSGEGFPPFPITSGGAPPFTIPFGGAPPFPLPSGGFPPFPMPSVITTTISNCGIDSPAPEITNPAFWNGATVTVTTTVTEISSSGAEWMSSLFVSPSVAWRNSSSPSTTTTRTAHAAGPGPEISTPTTTKPETLGQSSVESSGSGLNLSDSDFYAYLLMSLFLSLVVAWLA